MSQVQVKPRTVLTNLILIATIFSILVIGLGAYTRLVHAGLGCPDWPLCYGHFWAPEQGGELTQANVKFPDAPVDLDKTWPEMTHRYLATSLGVFCIAILWLGIRARKEDHSVPIKHATGLLAFIILQGLFGMWTVTLKLWPQVVTLHLAGGFTTFCLLLLLYLRMRPRSASLNTSSRARVLAGLSLVVVALQVLIGGWLTSNYAAMACVELPLCKIDHLTKADFFQGFDVLQQIGPNYLGGQLDGDARIAIHATHRFGAIASMIVLLSLAFMLKKLQHSWALIVLLALTTIQVGLGITNVYFGLPLFNAVAHNIAGALLLACLVWINFNLRSGKNVTREKGD